MIKIDDATGVGMPGLKLSVRDLTGTHQVEVSGLDPSLRVSTVAETIASRMSLPTDGTPWSLRTESTARYLDDVPIGEALGRDAESEVSLVLGPKSHLG
jgi:hypothetical protein